MRKTLIQPLASRYARPAGALLIFAGLAYVVATGQPSLVPSVFRPTLIQHALYVLLGAGYVAFLVLRRRLPGPTRLDLPLAALVLVYAAAVATSVYPRVSFEASLLIAAVVLTFYALHDFNILDTATLFRGIVALGALLALLALYSSVESYVDWLQLVDAVDGESRFSNLLPPTVPRVHGIGDHVNVLAMALNLTLPFALALALRPSHAFERWPGVVTALLLLVALFFTLSRGAWLGTIVGLAVFATLYSLRGRDLGSQARRYGRHLLVAGVGGLLIVLMAGGLFATRWDSRPEWLFRASLSPRQDAASAALEIIRDRPLLGSGPHTYPLLYSTYSGAYPIENIHPHNGYLNDLVDIGVVGGLVLAVAGVTLLLAMLQAYRLGDPTRRTMLAACAAALASLGVHAFFDSPNPWQTALFPFAAVLAVTLRLCLSPSTRLGLSLPPRALMLALAPLLLGGLLFLDPAHAGYNASVRALGHGSFGEASAKALAAADADPGSAAYHLHAGTAQAVEYLVSIDRGDPSPALLDSSVASLRRAIDADPRSGIAQINLALTLRLRGDGPGAVVAAHDALERVPGDAAVATAAGTVFEWAGLTDDAARAYARAFSYDSALSQSPYWQSRPELRTSALALSSLTACERGRVTVLYGIIRDDIEPLLRDCEAYVAAAPNDTLARYGLVVLNLGLGRNEEARADAEEAVRRVPDAAFARIARALTYGPSGDLGQVRHELLLGTYLGEPDAALLLAATYAPESSPFALAVPSAPEPLPEPVRDRLRTVLPASAAMVYDDGVQHYLLGVLYYRVRFWRESPTSILLPGDWLQVVSPRARAVLDALRLP